MEWLIVIGIVLFLLYQLFKWLFTTSAGLITLAVLLSPIWLSILWKLLKVLGVGLVMLGEGLRRLGVFLGRFSAVAALAPAQAVSSWFVSPVSTCPTCYELAHHSYTCPSCLSVEPLAPSLEYGALHWTCSCGDQLPTTDVGGRARLRTSCIACGERFETLRGSERHVAFFGTYGADKTSVALTAMRGLVQEGYTLPGASRDLRDAIGKANSSGAGSYKSGCRPHAIRLAPARGKGALYLYNPDDEAYLSQVDAMELVFLERVRGIVCVIDPARSAVPAVERAKPRALDEDLYGRLLASLNSHRGSSNNNDVRLAVVVITKDPPSGDQATRSEHAESWMQQHDYGPLLRLITHDFTKVRFFFAVPATTEWQTEAAAAVRWAAGLPAR